MEDLLKQVLILVMLYLLAFRCYHAKHLAHKVKVQHKMATMHVPEEPICIIDGDNLDESIRRYEEMLDMGYFDKAA